MPATLVALGCTQACSGDTTPKAIADASVGSGATATTAGGGGTGSIGGGRANAGGSGGRVSLGGASAGGVTARGGVTASGGTSSGGATSSGGESSTGGASATSPDGGGAGAPEGGEGGDAPSPTSYGAFTGVCAYLTQDFPALRAIGIKNARMDRPSAAVIQTARTYGIEVLPIADYGIAELSGQSDDKYPPLPENRAEWSRRVVDTWRDMQDPPRVIEVWNEPWNAGFWKPQPDAAAYLELVKAFAKEAWGVWPNVRLLVSADEVYPQQKFREPLLQADTAGFLNDPRILPTTHNYVEGRAPTEVTGNPCSYDLNRFECAYADFKAHGHLDPQVWVTEFGWESDTAGGTNAVTPVTEALQASYTTDALRIFRTSGHVAKAFAFMFNRNDPWNYNWLRPDNSQKPVCSSVKALIASGK